MAVVKMNKLLLVSTNDERKEVFKKMHKIGCVHISSSALSENMNHNVNIEEDQVVNRKLNNLMSVFRFNKEISQDIKNIVKKEKIKNYKGIKRPLLKPIPTIDFDSFYQLEENEKEIFLKIDSFLKIENDLNEIKSKKAKINNLISQLMPYINVDVKLSLFRDLKNVSIVLGLLPENKIQAFEMLKEKYDTLITFKFGDGKQIPVAYLIWKEDSGKLSEDLSKIEFSSTSLNEDEVPKNIIKLLQEKIENLNCEKIKKIKEAMNYDKYFESFRLYYDYYKYQKDLKDIEKALGSTKEATLYEAWIPESIETKLREEFSTSNLHVYLETYEPSEDEEPPTFIKGNAITTPYQAVTNMLEVPKYREIDPNPFVTIFFIFMSGLMLGDAGYGVLLTLLTGLVLICKRPKRGKMNLVKLVFMIGLSTIFWGIMFGTYFGFSVDPNGIPRPEGITKGIIKPGVWFDILEHPIAMMKFGVVIGAIQMLVGFFLKSYILVTREKKYFAAFIHFFGWFFLMLGIFMIAAKAVAETFVPSLEGTNIIKVPAIIPKIGKILAIIGVIFIAIDGTFGKKKFGKVTGAFTGIYGIINVLSDALSYTRLFGLGLATGVIGLVFNQIAAVMLDLFSKVPVIGWIIAIIVFIVGHSFNLVINTLGTYVHDARLQFVEFFGKFYEGGGEMYKPLGSTFKNYEITGVDDYQKVKIKNKKNKNLNLKTNGGIIKCQ